jgi:hypothetical protein
MFLFFRLDLRGPGEAEDEPSALPLLVTRVFADDPNDAFAADHLAFVANLFDARPDFHDGFSLLGLTCDGR